MLDHGIAKKQRRRREGVRCGVRAVCEHVVWAFADDVRIKSLGIGRRRQRCLCVQGVRASW
jgi:hypothetical protein